MRTIRWYQLTILMLLAPYLYATTGPKILVKRAGTSVWVTSFNYWYQDVGTFRSIRDVDFRNLKVMFFYGQDRLGQFEPSEIEPYQLKNGQFSKRDPTGGGEGVFMDDLQYFGSPHGPDEHALLSLRSLSCGGSCSENGDVLVFQLQKGRLWETQQITYDFQAPGAGADFSPKTGTLVVAGRYQDLSAHCCPDKLEVAAFKWDGKAFHVQSVKARLITRNDHWGEGP